MGLAEYGTFSEVRARLDEILVEVRKKDLSLEKSLDLYEEAIKLGNRCAELVDKPDFTEQEAQAAMEAIEGKADGADADGAGAEGGIDAGDGENAPGGADAAGASGGMDDADSEGAGPEAADAGAPKAGGSEEAEDAGSEAAASGADGKPGE